MRPVDLPTSEDCSTAEPSVCLLCGAGQLTLYLASRGKRLSAAALGSSRAEVCHGKILRCQSCSFAFLEERISDGELAHLYRELDGKLYESQIKGRQVTAERHLKILSRYAQPGCLLDVGCASGAFLGAAANAGWTVTGIEPARGLYETAAQKLEKRGTVLCCTLQESKLPPGSFDAVTLWDVLEHVVNPVRFMQDCAALLKPGGHLLLNVPDLDSLQSRCLRSRWPLLLPEHLNYFNRRSLKLCGSLADLNWIHFGQRPALFSVGYILYRLKQHRIPGAALGYAIASRLRIGAIYFPIYLGETYGVWQRGT